MNTLTKLNFYLFVPAFSFVNICSTEISAGLVRVVILNLTLVAVNFGVGSGLAGLLRLPKRTARAFENSLMFNNSGNIGVSLMTLVYSSPPFNSGGAPLLEAALSVQVMTLLVQNLTTNTIGFINGGGEGASVKTGIIRVIKMPTLYAVTLAISLKFLPFDISVTPMWPALSFLRNGLVSFALVTLGVQLSKARINLRLKTPYLAAFFRLIGGPSLAFLMIKLFGFEGVTAQAIFIASSTPTAVNTALLSLECGGDSDFAVQAVTVSTILSAVTMTATIYLAYVLF